MVNRQVMYDMLLNELFIFGKNVLTNSITRIFNHILHVVDVGFFPTMLVRGCYFFFE